MVKIATIVGIVLSATCSVSIAFAQVSAYNEGVLYPAPLDSWKTRRAVEIGMMKMPEAVVEESDTYRWPSVTFDLWLGLPAHLMFDCRVTTQVINWHVQAGPKWQWIGLEPIGIAVGADVGYFMGGIGSSAFDNSNQSTFFYPNLAVGWRNHALAVTVKAEASYCLAKLDRAGDIEVAVTKNFFNGATVGVYLEQPFWGTTNFELGVRYGYLRYAYQNWLLFPTIGRYYGLPEFMIGIRV